MTLKEAIESFFLSRKCVKRKLKDRDDAWEVAEKNARNEAYAVGKRDGYNEAWKEANPTVGITLHYGVERKVGKATYRPYTSTTLEISDPARAKKGELLDDIRVRTAIETLVRLVCDAERNVAEEYLKKQAVKMNYVPAEQFYRDALRKVVENADYVEKCTGDFAKAIDNARYVLSLTFDVNGEADITQKPPLPETFVPHKVADDGKPAVQ